MKIKAAQRLIQFDPSVNTIYCDLDGVLADFEAGVLKYARLDAATCDPKLMWARLQKIPKFYQLLKPMPHAGDLWRVIKSTRCKRAILTALPLKSTMPEAEQDKRIWCADRLGPKEVVKVGPYSKDKWKHCNPGDLLIDDSEDNIDDWTRKGKGIGIYHTDVESTIEQLFSLTRGA